MNDGKKMFFSQIDKNFLLSFTWSGIHLWWLQNYLRVFIVTTHSSTVITLSFSNESKLNESKGQVMDLCDFFAFHEKQLFCLLFSSSSSFSFCIALNKFLPLECHFIEYCKISFSLKERKKHFVFSNLSKKHLLSTMS